MASAIATGTAEAKPQTPAHLEPAGPRAAVPARRRRRLSRLTRPILAVNMLALGLLGLGLLYLGEYQRSLVTAELDALKTQSLVQDYVRLKNLGDGQRPTGRMVALVGDAELDEGNIFEALLEGWKHDVRNLWWVIDYNRQSLDAVVNDRLFARSARCSNRSAGAWSR